MFRSSLQTDVGSHNPLLFGARLCWHSFPSPTASRYCSLWTFPFRHPLKDLKTCLLRRGFHTLIKNVSFFSPTDVGSHNPLLFGVQRPCRHCFPSPTANRYCPLWIFPFGLPLNIFKTHLLGRDFHTFTKNVSSPLQPM